MKKKIYYLTICIISSLSTGNTFAQIGIENSTPRGALDINKPTTTNNMGLVLPTNADPNNLINPMGGAVAIGTIMYDSTLSCVRVFRSSGWSNCLCDECNNAGLASRLTCNGALTGIYKSGISSSGSKIINYAARQGQSYGAISIASTGVTGLTATAPAGIIANDNGTIELSINGIPSGEGIANFVITLGGRTCDFQIQVTSANNFAFKCGEAQFFGNTSVGGTSSGQLRIPYINGNGASYAGGKIFNSTGVTGLTATSLPSTLNNNNPLDFTVTGTANQQGYAVFNISILNSVPCVATIQVPIENH
jgi:hypothetical protein